MIKSVLNLVKFPVIVENVLFGVSKFSRLNDITSRHISTTLLCNREIRMENTKVKVGKSSKYGILEGEASLQTENVNTLDLLFPDADTPNRLFNGVPFKNLHIVNIKSTPNNTIMTFTDYKGKVISLHSSGVEGFKNAKKGTNIAAQQAAITFGNRIREYGINTVRVRVQGIGAGRMSSIKGLQMTELNIISITDDTRVSDRPPRPRKRRRV